MRLRIRQSAWAAVLLAAALPAQQNGLPPGTYRAGGDVTAPKVTASADPQFTDAARQARLQGVVDISLIVGTDGQPHDLKILKSLGLGLDESALTTVSQWRFQPGTKAGRPVPVFTKVQVSYRLLLDPKMWRVTKAAFDVPDGTKAPVLTRAEYPQFKGASPAATVTLTFDITEKGEPKNLQAESGSDMRYSGEVQSLVKKWRFQPAARAGAPVASKATFNFARGK